MNIWDVEDQDKIKGWREYVNRTINIYNNCICIICIYVFSINKEKWHKICTNTSNTSNSE